VSSATVCAPTAPPTSSPEPAALETAAAILGYAGAALIAGAYFANQRGTLRSDDWRFPALNLAGSLGVLVSLVAEPNLPSILIEIFWASISLYGLWRSLRARRQPGR